MAIETAPPGDALRPPSGQLDCKLMEKLFAESLKLSKEGLKLQSGKSADIGQFAFSVLAVVAGFIPGVGSAASALCNLLGSVFFPSSASSIWAAVAQQAGELVKQELKSYDLEDLKKELEGLDSNVTYYNEAVNHFDESGTEQAKYQLQIAYGTTLGVVAASVPKFQKEGYEVAELTLFAIAANIHLTLLADCVKNGSKWGYDDDFVTRRKKEFDLLVSDSADVAIDEIRSEQTGLLNRAVKDAPRTGAPGELVRTWEKAARELSAQTGTDSDSYTAYATSTTAYGAEKVASSGTPDFDYDQDELGGPEGAHMKMTVDYATFMKIYVMSFVNLWPYLVEGISEEGRKEADMEFHYGPLGRGVNNVPPLKGTPPDRWAPITAVRLWAYNSVDAFQLKYGDTWGAVHGKIGGVQQSLDLHEGEYISWVWVEYGDKVGNMEFYTSEGRSVSGGCSKDVEYHGRKSSHWYGADDYGLTGAYGTQYGGGVKPGLEGVFLTFRSQVFV